MSASQGPVPFSMYTANTLSAIGMSVKVQLVEDLMRLSPITLRGAVPHCMVETDGSWTVMHLMVCVVNMQATDTSRIFLWHTYMSGLS